MGLVQLVPQEELAPTCLRLIGRRAATGLLIGVERLERLDAGVEGAVLAWIAPGGAVPAAVVELLAEEVVDEAHRGARRGSHEQR